jgi:hypothetical protein
VIALIPPRPPGYQRDRELFEPHTGLTFDPLAAAESWVNTALDLLFNPQRLARIVEQSARAKSDLSLGEIFDGVLKTAAADANANSYSKELGRMIEKQTLQHLLRLALDPAAQQQVNAAALQKITELETAVKSRPTTDPGEAAHNAYLAFQIDRFRRNPKDLEFPKPPRLPEGPPIGAE